MRSSLYHGTVTHIRQAPKQHRLTYSVAYLMVDLDEWDTLGSISNLFGVDRAGFMSLKRRNFLDGADTPLKPRVEALVRAQGIQGQLGSVRLLTYPRMFGYMFNPVSVYLCEDTVGRGLATIYEVNNTFGERHHYVVPMQGDAKAAHCATKVFYVSPFMETSGRYRFRVLEKGDRFAVAMESVDADGSILNASFRGHQMPLTAANIRATIFKFPLMTLKVTAGIHWEALKLWRKGLKVYGHKASPHRAQHITLGSLMHQAKEGQ